MISLVELTTAFELFACFCNTWSTNPLSDKSGSLQ